MHGHLIRHQRSRAGRLISAPPDSAAMPSDKPRWILASLASGSRSSRSPCSVHTRYATVPSSNRSGSQSPLSGADAAIWSRESASITTTRVVGRLEAASSSGAASRRRSSDQRSHSDSMSSKPRGFAVENQPTVLRATHPDFLGSRTQAECLRRRRMVRSDPTKERMARARSRSGTRPAPGALSWPPWHT